jgi:hypothetical protein
MNCGIVLVGSGATSPTRADSDENGRDPRITNLAGAGDWLPREIVRAADLVIAIIQGSPTSRRLRHADPHDLLRRSPAAGMAARRPSPRHHGAGALLALGTTKLRNAQTTICA